MNRGAIGLLVIIALAVSLRAALDSSAQEPDRGAIFVCGNDQQLPAPIPLSWAAIVLAGDSRFYVPCPKTNHPIEHRENRETTVIAAGTKSADAEQRWRAAQAEVRLHGDLGRFILDNVVRVACDAEIQVFNQVVNGMTRFARYQPGRLFFMLRDPNAAVRREAAYAIGVALAKPDLQSDVITAATKEARACLKMPKLPQTAASGGLPAQNPVGTDREVTGLLLAALGVARYATGPEAADAEAFLTRESVPLVAGPGMDPGEQVLKVLGAVTGLEALIRQNPNRGISDSTRARLRELTTFGARTASTLVLDPEPRIRRIALMALQTARDSDYQTLSRAAQDRDWQVRRIVAASLNLSDPSQALVGDELTRDDVFQVRYDLLGPIARLAGRTRECASIIERFKDPSPAVVMRAMDVLVPACTYLGDAITQLKETADDLAKTSAVTTWHVPSRALAALARVKPDEAKPRLASALNHSTWQVRAAAAAVAVTLGDEEAAIALARDREPNVRTAALDALFRMKSTSLVPQALEALKTGEDYQLLWKAAGVLKGLPESAREDASKVLLGTLQRLTAQEMDTSRDPRVAIIERLAETLDSTRSNDILPYITDYDDAVAAAAVKTFTAVLGSPPAPDAAMHRRYPYQPSLAQVNALPDQAEIHLESGGVVMLQLLRDVAPVTVARFAALVTKGYYNSLTFHRIVPNFVVQGGSPGANEYVGSSRFMRDEVGPQGVHVRGAVGISTRGGDTGDGQIFIDLIDLPRLDRDYTVFAYVTQGMEFVDRMLDGARIVSISIK